MIIENVLVVLNYNDYNTIEKFLNNAVHIESIDKLIVVDNCSTDNSFEKLRAYESEKTDVIKTEKNGGYAILELNMPWTNIRQSMCLFQTRMWSLMQK